MTTPERHEKVYELFVNARKLDDAACAAYLDKACADDPSLREEVEALLAQDSEMTSFLEQPPAPTPLGSTEPDTISSAGKPPAAESRASDALAGIIIEGYEILRELHRGGQGVVFQAVQKSTKRKVAIKVLREGPYASKSAQKRFEREIELVAQLKHPNIIVVFDSGTTAGGWQYCAMDYVRGTQLHHYIRDNKLTLEETLSVFKQVCDAVQYAHHKGVIHRDLKPSNILVDSEGNAKVLDFGLAKQMVGPIQTVVSITQEIIGTLPYMSPEQAKGNPDHIDTRTDIYALGVILYEILTGHYPYPVVGQMADVLKHIAETPPTPPRSQWTPESGVTKRSSKHLRPGKCPIDDELQTVILKTLSKERERRYQSAGELGRDIQHYLAGDPIEAKRDSGLYVLRKTLRRYRTRITVLSISTLLLLGFGVTIWRQHNAQVQARRQADIRDLLHHAVSGVPLGDRQQETLCEICDRLRTNSASPLDAQAFVTAFITLEVGTSTFKVFSESMELTMIAYVAIDAVGCASGLGVLLESNVIINGEEAPASLWSEHPLWIEDSRIMSTHSSGFSGSPGTYQLSGSVSVQVAEQLPANADTSANGASAEATHRVITLMPVDIPIPASTFIVVKSLPDTYPPKIVDEDWAKLLNNGFTVEANVLTTDEVGGERATDRESASLTEQSRLSIRLSFPKVPYMISYAMTVGVQDIEWRPSILCTHNIEGIAGCGFWKWQDERINSHTGIGSWPGPVNEDRLIVDLFFDGLSPEFAEILVPGNHLQITIAAEYVSEPCLDFGLERSVVITSHETPP